MAVMIISFAATSLDTACRIQRYIIGEFGVTLKMKTLENRYVGSFIAVASAFLLMITSDGGKGGLAIWPLFGATNQMLAGLTLILICLDFCNSYYKRRAYLQSDPLSLSEELLLGRPKLSSELDPIMDFSGGHESL